MITKLNQYQIVTQKKAKKSNMGYPIIHSDQNPPYSESK